MRDSRFAGKVVVVTGGTRGIGWRCAERFAAEGATVLACGHDSAELAHARANAPARVAVVAMDVRDEAGIEALFAGDPHLAAGVDVLVNCAGIQRFGSVTETDLATWNDVLAVNLTGAFLASRHAIPGMRRRGGGAVVHVGSIHSRLTVGARAAYVASKTALVGLTRAMALDHAAEGIRVNIVHPGAIDTPMITEGWTRLRPDRTADQMRELVGAANPVARMGEPDDVASMILYLASSEAGFVTGSEFFVDGGIGSRLALPVVRPAA